MALTDTAIRKAKAKDRSYKLADGAGLYLEVMPNGARYWRMRYRIAGKDTRLARYVSRGHAGRSKGAQGRRQTPVA